MESPGQPCLVPGTQEQRSSLQLEVPYGMDTHSKPKVSSLPFTTSASQSLENRPMALSKEIIVSSSAHKSPTLHSSACSISFFFSPWDNMKTQQRISCHRVCFLLQKQKEMPCLRKHLLLALQRGRARARGTRDVVTRASTPATRLEFNIENALN